MKPRLVSAVASFGLTASAPTKNHLRSHCTGHGELAAPAPSNALRVSSQPSATHPPFLTRRGALSLLARPQRRPARKVGVGLEEVGERGIKGRSNEIQQRDDEALYERESREEVGRDNINEGMARMRAVGLLGVIRGVKASEKDDIYTGTWVRA